MREVRAGQIEQAMRQVWQTEALEVQRLCDAVDFSEAERLAKALEANRLRGGRLFFAGMGTSAAAAKKAAHTFCCVEFPAAFLSPGDAVHGGMGAVQPGDVVVLISKGGGTREIQALFTGLKAKRATIVGVTEKPDSPLGKAADLLVRIRVEKEPDAFNMLATASTMAVIAFFDALAIYLMDKSGYTRDQFTVIHPGGAVGDRLVHKQP